MWGSAFPVFIDIISVPRFFFQAKHLPSPLWKACDYVLHYKFVIVHVAGAVNTAVDFRSRMEVNPIEKLQEMSICNDIQTEALEINIQSSRTSLCEHIYIIR